MIATLCVTDHTVDDEADAQEAKMPTKRLKGQAYVDAKAKSKNRPKPKPTVVQDDASPTDSAPPKKKRIMEVVIPRLSSAKRARLVSSASSSSEKGPAQTDEEDDEDEDSEPRARRKAAAKRPIIIDDDDDDDVKTDEKEESDYSHDEDEESDAHEPSDDESDASDTAMTSESEDDQPKRKAKPKAKPKPPAKAAKSVASSSRSSDMDVDEPEPVSKKRKADETGKATAKQQKRREDTDPWKLESKSVKSDWTNMCAPPLEMFQFARLVVDEYTYLVGQELYMISGLSATRRWVLSGTPPISDLSAVKTISAFLNISLGSADEADCVVKSSNDDKNRVKAEPTSEFLVGRI